MTRLRLLSLFLLLTLAACTAPEVQVHGVAVADETLVKAVIALHAIETADVALGAWLIQRHRDACRGLSDAAKLVELACVRATTNLRAHATEYAPRLLKAVQAARDVLTTLATRPSTATPARLHDAVAQAQTALTVVSAWGQSVGWVPEATTTGGTP